MLISLNNTLNALNVLMLVKLTFPKSPLNWLKMSERKPRKRPLKLKNALLLPIKKEKFNKIISFIILNMAGDIWLFMDSNFKTALIKGRNFGCHCGLNSQPEQGTPQ